MELRMEALGLEKIDDLVVKLIGHAAMAKAYGDAIRRQPGLAAGFGRLEEKHRAALRTLGEEIGRATA